MGEIAPGEGMHQYFPPSLEGHDFSRHHDGMKWAINRTREVTGVRIVDIFTGMEYIDDYCFHFKLKKGIDYFVSWAN